MSNRSPNRAHAQGRAAAARPVRDADRAARYTEAVRDISEDATVVSEKLLNSAYSADPSGAELMQHVVALDRLQQEAAGVLVARQRAQGKPLADLAQLLNLTEDRTRKKFRLQDVDEALRNRRRPQRTLPADTIPNAPNLLRAPRQRLASALTLMWRASGRRQYEIAQRMGVDGSYVSRMLSGQREASWQHVLAICEVCEGDLALMKPLWEAAAGGRPPDGGHIEHLRTYLRALRYAAGSPKTEVILESARHTITATELHLALNGPGVPAWPTVANLIVALQGMPETARPLWRRAQAATESSA